MFDVSIFGSFFFASQMIPLFEAVYMRIRFLLTSVSLRLMNTQCTPFQDPGATYLISGDHAATECNLIGQSKDFQRCLV